MVVNVNIVWGYSVKILCDKESDQCLNKLKRRAYIAISIYVILLSTLPLVNDVLSNSGWVGYGWGAYMFDDGVISVRFSEIQYGVDKPKIYVHPKPYYSLRPIDAVEISDHESFVDMLNIYRDAENMTVKIIDRRSIEYTYTYPNLTLRKVVTVLPNNSIVVRYETSKDVLFRVSIWRWYYARVAGISFNDTRKTTEITLNNVTSIEFEFHDKEYGAWIGQVSFNMPINARICMDDVGINKFIVETVSRELWFVITIYSNTSAVISPVTAFFKTLLSVKGTRIVLPVIAIVLVIYGWRRWIK